MFLEYVVDVEIGTEVLTDDPHIRKLLVVQERQRRHVQQPLDLIRVKFGRGRMRKRESTNAAAVYRVCVVRAVATSMNRPAGSRFVNAEHDVTATDSPMYVRRIAVDQLTVWRAKPDVDVSRTARLTVAEHQSWISPRDAKSNAPAGRIDPVLLPGSTRPSPSR